MEQYQDYIETTEILVVGNKKEVQEFFINNATKTDVFYMISARCEFADFDEHYSSIKEAFQLGIKYAADDPYDFSFYGVDEIIEYTINGFKFWIKGKYYPKDDLKREFEKGGTVDEV